MNRFYVLVLSLFAVSVLGTALVSSASAESTLGADWLINEVPVAEGKEEPMSIESEILLEDTKTSAGAAAVLCAGILDGSLLAGGEGLVTKVLNLKGEEIGELGGLALLGEGTAGTDCVKESACGEGSSASPIEVHPTGLPWSTLLVQKEISSEVSAYLVLVFKFGYEILCLVLGLNVEDSCSSSETGFEVVKDSETGEAEVPSGATAEPLANCSLGGTATGVEEYDALALFTSTAGKVKLGSGFLRWENAQLLVVTGQEGEFNVEYLGFGKAGIVSLTLPMGFELKGGTCTMGTKEAPCTYKIKCTGVMGTKGMARVVSNLLLVASTEKEIRCT